jgi:hypothetical protein
MYQRQVGVTLPQDDKLFKKRNAFGHCSSICSGKCNILKHAYHKVHFLQLLYLLIKSGGAEMERKKKSSLIH